MNHMIRYLNFAGVCSLAALCGWQWSVTSELVHGIQGLQQQAVVSKALMEKQAGELKEKATVLEDLNRRLKLCEVQLAQANGDLKKGEVERDQLMQLRDKLLTAVGERDKVVEQQNEVLHKLQEQRNGAVARCNEIVAKYNAMVGASAGR